MKSKQMLIVAIFSAFTIFAHTGKGKSFEQLVKQKYVLSSIPKELKGIWIGKLLYKEESSDSRYEREDVINMCNYPIIHLRKSKGRSDKEWLSYESIEAIAYYTKHTVKSLTIFEITIQGFSNNKALEGLGPLLYYHPTNDIMTEEPIPYNTSLKVSMEYKRTSCPNEK